VDEYVDSCKIAECTAGDLQKDRRSILKAKTVIWILFIHSFRLFL